MNDQLFSDGQKIPPVPTPPGGALDQRGGSCSNNVPDDQRSAQKERAGDGGAIETPGGAMASEDFKPQNDILDSNWPPPGVALYTTDEARLYLYDNHNVLLKERFIQKLVTDQHKLDGRRVPKDGGGVELQITETSLDEYAMQNPQKKNAKDTPLDPEDKLFDELRTIANAKGFTVMIEGAAHEPIETPTPAHETVTETPTPDQPENLVETPPANEAPQDAHDMVPKRLLDEANERIKDEHNLYIEMQQINMKLYDTLDSTQERLADTNKLLASSQEKLASIAEAVADKIESPSEIVRSLSEAFRAANGEGERLPPMPMNHNDRRPGDGGDVT